MLRADYRLHQQHGASFFTAAAELEAPLRTGDSDLETFVAHGFGGAVSLDVPLRRRQLLVDLGYARYVRDNGLSANIYSCSVALRL